MKLQKNNKYTKRITAGLISAILSASILVGCSNTQALTPTSTKIVEVTPIPIEKELGEKQESQARDKMYFINYYKISDNEVKDILKEYDIKNKNAKWNMFFISTVVVQDKNNDYKVLQCIEKHDEKFEITEVYDLFTEEHLFDIPYVHSKELDNFYRFKNVDFSQITNASTYFNDKKFVEYGLSICSSIFFASHYEYFYMKDGIEYNHPGFEPAYVMYSRGDFTKEYHTTEEIAECYVRTVPEECRVSSKELGLSSTYSEERKYADFWKISDEEKKSRLKEFEIYKGDSIINMSELQTLILKDSNEEYKILNTFIIESVECLKIYDAISGLYLFSIDNNEKNIEKIELKNIYDEIPYFEDKTLIKFEPCFGSNDFIFNYIEKLREKDNVEYELPNIALKYYLYPKETFNTDDLNYTINQIVDCYVSTVPKWLQVTTKELSIDLNNVIENNEKVLVK